MKSKKLRDTSIDFIGTFVNGLLVLGRKNQPTNHPTEKNRELVEQAGEGKCEQIHDRAAICRTALLRLGGVA